MKKGAKHTPEAIERMRLNRFDPWTNPETRKKVSESLRKAFAEGRRKPPKGEKFTAEKLTQFGKLWHKKRSQNQEWLHGISEAKKGESNPCAELTEDQVREMICLYNENPEAYTTTILGERYRVKRQTAADILYGRTWRHVTGGIDQRTGEYVEIKKRKRGESE